jgi:hypothetical protein
VTAVEILQSALRRWPIVLSGLLLTLVAGYQAMHARGDYETAADIVFFGPHGPKNANAWLPDEGVINVASVIGTAMNGPEVRNELRAAGVRDRYELVLHNSGNQFVPIYNEPVLDMSVAGADPASVRQSTLLIVARVRSELEQRQRSLGAAERTWVTIQLTPDDPAVVHGTGSPARALFASLFLGSVLTLLTAATVDTAIRRRRSTQGDPGRTSEERPPAVASLPSR